MALAFEVALMPLEGLIVRLLITTHAWQVAKLTNVPTQLVRDLGQVAGNISLIPDRVSILRLYSTESPKMVRSRMSDIVVCNSLSWRWEATTPGVWLHIFVFEG